MSNQEQIELQSTIEAQGVLNKQFARLIVEQVTSVMAGNLNAVLILIEKQHAESLALIQEVSADTKKLSVGQGEIVQRVSDVEEKVSGLDTRHGEQWSKAMRLLTESQADRARLHAEVDELRANLARRPTPEQTEELIETLKRIEARVFGAGANG